MDIKDLYSKNKLSKVGFECICPSCETPFQKDNYQQAFCRSKGGTVCKDKYWNIVNAGKERALAAMKTIQVEIINSQNSIEDLQNKINDWILPGIKIQSIYISISPMHDLYDGQSGGMICNQWIEYVATIIY